MNRGFTLVEMVVAIGLAAVLMGAVAALYVFYGDTIMSQTASIGVAHGAEAIASAINTAGLQADHVVASHSFSGTSYVSGATSTVFELPAVGASGEIIQGSYDYVGFYTSGTDAYEFTDAAAGSARVSGTKRLADSLDALSFSYDDPALSAATTVTVDATTSASVKGTVFEMHLREKVYLRNP